MVQGVRTAIQTSAVESARPAESAPQTMRGLGDHCRFVFVMMAVASAAALASCRHSARVAEPGNVVAIEGSDDFDLQSVGVDRPVLVEFQKSWCPACEQLQPTLERLAAEYAGKARFLSVDVEQLPDLKKRFGVRFSPTVILLVDGKETARWVNEHDAAVYRAAIDRAHVAR